MFSLASYVKKSKNYASAQKQICEEVGRFLPESVRDAIEQGALTISMFVRDEADVFISHATADKNYLFSRDEDKNYCINKFSHVIVVGEWLKEKLIANPGVTLEPWQIHVGGAPRIDHLRRVQATTSHQEASPNDRKRRILWAPGHDSWRLNETPLSSYPALEDELVSITDIDVVTALHPRNREKKGALVTKLLDADVVISDYSSIVYEAWALGKPVIFPRWLLGDAVLQKAKNSAEAYIFGNEIGYHAHDREEFHRLLREDLMVDAQVSAFLQRYLANHKKAASGEQIANLLTMIADGDSQASVKESYQMQKTAVDQQDWSTANKYLDRRLEMMSAKLPLFQKSAFRHEKIILLREEYKTAATAKDWADAERILWEILELDENSAEDYNKLGSIFRKQEKWWQEVEAMKKAVALDERHATWFYRLGEGLEAMKRFREASTAYGRSIKLRPKLAEWHYRLGYSLGREGHDGAANPKASASAYDVAIELDSKHGASRFGIGVFHQQRGYWKDAAEAYRERLRFNPNDPELHYRQGMALDRCYEWAQAEEAFVSAISLDFAKPDWHYRLGFVREKQGKYIEAAQAYEYAALSRSQHTPYWFYRWAYSLDMAGNEVAACAAYTKIKKFPVLPDWLDDENELESTGQPGGRSSKSSEFTGYVADLVEFERNALKKKLEQDATHYWEWKQLGKLHEKQGSLSVAATCYREAIRRQEQHRPETYFRLGYVLTHQKDYAAACEAFRNYRVLRRPHGVDESHFRKNESFREVATYTEYHDLLPIANDIVVYESFHGAGMSCNPYALFLALDKNTDYQGWTHVWVLNNKLKIPPELRQRTDVIFVSRGSDAYLRYLASAKLLINNSTFAPYFIRKPEQIYLNTWHGTPWKTLGEDMKGRFYEHKNFTRNILQSTHLLSPNPHTTEVLMEKHGVKEIYTGQLLELGYPRIDLVLRQDPSATEALRLKLGVSPDKRLALYAPTWRGTHGEVDFDFSKLEEDMERLSSLDGWHIVFRGHSILEEKLTDLDLNGVTLAPEDIDTNELLAITDLLITDYSSVLFDYLPRRKPIILYVYDFDEYKAERGLYFELEEMPGAKCFDIEAVVETIAKLGSGSEAEIHAEWIERFAPHDDGQVSERVITAIQQPTTLNIPENKRSLLFFGGPFMGNGITTSYLNLLSHIDSDRYTRSIVIDPGSIQKEEARLSQFAKLPEGINVIPRVGRMNMTLEDRYLHGLRNRDFSLPSNTADNLVVESWEREYKRVFGNAHFDSLIHFEGYNKFWAGVFSMGGMSDQKKLIYQHNNKHGEWSLKYPYLELIFNSYKQFDRVVSVSELTRDVNQELLNDTFDIDKSKFVYSENVQNPAVTLALSECAIDLNDSQYFCSDEPVFVNIGRLSTEKGHSKLIKAFSTVRKEFPDIQLLIIGDGPLYKKLASEIRDLGQVSNIHLLGQRSNPFPILKRSNCFVLSSDHEGQPMVLFEALLLQKPIISTDIPGARGVLQHRGGVLVENSVDGLVKAMTQYCLQEHAPFLFDSEKYQKNAVNQFYNLINL